MFPEINRIRKVSTYVNVFRGLNRTENCGFGAVGSRKGSYMTELLDMKNMSCDDHPRLGTRKLRSSMSIPDGVTSNVIIFNGGLVYTKQDSYNVVTQAYKEMLIVSGTEYAIEGYIGNDENNVNHRLTLYGARVIIMPEKLIFDLTAHTFSDIEFESDTLSVDATALNVATYNGGNYMKQTRNFRDFSIQKCELDDDGVPRVMNYIYEKAYGLDNYAAQTSTVPIDDEADTPEAWQSTYFMHWHTIKEGETVEAQGESPSGLYRCVEIMKSYSYSDGTTTYNANKKLRRFIKVDAYYVKISRNQSSGMVFDKVQKGDFVKISGMVDSVTENEDTTYNVAALSTGAQDGDWTVRGNEWGNYISVLNNNTFKVYYADDNCIVIKAQIDRSVPYTGPMKVSRVMPDIDEGLMLEVNNRLWACSSESNEIYSCKQGDPANWQAYGDGAATDSFAATVGCEGAFTGIARQNDSVIFFKENWIVKLFGTKPSNYTLATYNVPGVESGSEKSVVWVNGVLYYLSHLGVCQYSPGGQPVIISERAFGNRKYSNAVAGRHRSKYVISAQNDSDGYELFCFDTEKGLWTKEDDTAFEDCATYNNVLYYTSQNDNYLRCMDSGNNLLTNGTAEDDFEWFFETPNLYEDDFCKKYISKIQFSVKTSENVSATVYAKFSNRSEWVELRRLHYAESRHAEIQVPVRRSEYLKLRIEGEGELILSAMQIDYARGSEKTWRF